MEYIDRRTAPEKKHSSALTVILVILAVLLAVTGVVSWLALSDPYAGTETGTRRTVRCAGADVCQVRRLPEGMQLFHGAK